MRGLVPCAMAFLLVACSSPPPAAPGESPAVRPDPVAGVEADKRRLFAALKSASDRGDLLAPASLQSMLSMDLQVTSAPGEIHSDCARPYGFSAITNTTATDAATSWYRARPTGRGRLPVPAFAINRASTTGDATLAYRVVRSVRCQDTGEGLVDSTEATLTFDGLPSYACVSADDIRRLWPAAEFVQATDGVSLFRYRGRVDRDVGTRTEFFFRAGVPCALGATIRQQQLWGWRYLDADYVYQTCRAQADRAFCAAQGDIAWPDDAALARMIDAGRTACGSPDAIYRENRQVTGPPPPTPRSRNRSRPCG